MPTDAGGGHGQRSDSQGRAQMVADRAGFHFPRKPKPDVNVHPDSRLAQPKQPEAWKGPHPFLQGHGFNGDIQSFNHRVRVAHDGYANAYKQEPSPGLLWDVAMSPGVEDGQIPDLFKIPLSQRDTKAQQWHLEAQHNGDSLHVREDGKVQPTNLQTAFRAKLGFNHPELQPTNPKAHVLSVQEFHKRYPLIMDGFTGMLPFGKKFWSDVAQSQGNPARYKQQIGFLTPKQAIGVADQAQNAQTAQAMQSAAMIDPTSTFNPDNPLASQKAHEGQVAANAKAGLTQAFGKAHSDAVSRNKQRQEWLLKHDPNGLFSGLQANGVFDREWMTKYDQWSRTPGAAYLAMQQIAKQNYFDPTPSGIKDMERAQQLKTKLANDSKKWSEKFQIEAAPLRFFSHGYFSQDHPLINNDGTPNTKEIHNLLTDFWKYEDTGTSWLWPVAALQGGFRFAKLGFDTLSGGFNQITADANGFTTLAGKGIPAILEGKSTKQIADMFATAVKQNPDWIRVLGFGYLPKNLRGNAAFLDGVGNFVVSSAIAMMAKGPGYWKVGEDVPLGKIQGNLAVKLMTRLAHSNIKAGDLWRAEQVLGPGDSEKFIVALEKDVKSGKLGHEDFHNLVTRYVKDGKVEYDGKAFDRPILPQLHTDKIPKSLTKLTLQQLGPQLRKGLNNLEFQALSAGNKFGSVSEASLRTLRNLFGLANPAGKSMHLFRPDMPARLESFIVNKGLASHDEATQIVNQFIRARSRENLSQMQKVLKGVSKAFRDKYPDTNFAAAPEFERMLETENLTYFRFPSRPLGNFKDAPGRAFMDAMNKIGSYWRSQILATGPGLFYKHLTRDTAAALMGGMKLRQSAEMVKAWDVAQGIMRDNPELFRQYSVSRKTLTGAETKYMLRNDGFAEGHADTWNLQEAIQQSPHLRQEFADRAAGHMHRLLTSKAYPAFQEAVRTGNMEPLVSIILRDKQFRHLLNRERGVAKKVQEQVRANFPAPGDSEIQFHENVALRNMLKRNIVHKEATEYAKLIFNRYKSVLDEGKSHGLGNVFDDVEKMMFAKPGTSDKEIAKYLLDHDLNLRVTGGTPVAMNKWDKTTGQLIRAYMSPNRFNRGRMFEHVFQQNYSNMLKMGYDPKEAFSSAVHISEHQTMYHMLDFSNMLEFEQRFRGFLPFFTKHRLFTKWLISRVAQYPYMAVPVSQVGKHLDSYGRLNFTFHGVPLNLSLSRLFWLNTQDLPVTVPGAEFVPYLNHTGLTPELTRFDSLIGAWVHGVGSGWNYKSVTAHMNPYDVRRLDKYMAVYAIHYRMHHGESAPVSESEALKYAMIRAGFFGGMTRDLIVNGAYLSPVTFSSPQTPGPIKKLDDQFSKLMNENPAKARAFLDKHPEAGLGWGMTQNFDLYNHVTQYWGLYDEIHSKYLKVEQKFSQQVLAGKPMSAEDYAKVRKAQQEYDQGIQHLLVQDARNWTQDAGGYKAGSVDQSGLISNYGPWGTLFLHDPIGSVNKLIAQFGGRKAFSSADLHKIYGYDTQGLQYAIDHYKELGLDTQARGDMIQKLNRIEGVYHVTGTPTLYSAYSQARSKFESKLIGLYNKAKNESGYAKAVTEYQARQLILSNYENPTLKYGGKDVKVLPFAEFNLATKTPQELSLQIWKNMVGFSYSTLTFDQKQLLGIKTTPQVDEGWGVFNSWVADYQQQYGKEASSSVREQLAVAANREYPGFFRDWKIAHLPKAFVLLYYAKGAFQGQYGNLWQQLAQRAATTYDTNRREWANQVPALDQWIRQNWPKGFVNEYQAAGGAQFLQGLISPWG